ncbi:MAG TPA: transketolase C-terminal domain-containing protein [Steroidobacteraceae bacterium]|nr:transketolase C-terminal domain-containing protein [Steroidobacteraceae bacterium]HUK02207.1 transketolase C-terminal domain-containing protein [Steroidobacteraceae bacterium]
MARKRYIQAINEALFEEMGRDPKVILFGEDVELAIMGDTRGLHEKFGHDRIRNTPICEASLTGMAVGAAAAGSRVVLHMMFSNFIYTGFDAIANQMAKLRLMTGGQATMPITIIAAYGGGGSNAAQHSDSGYPVLLNLGGVNVVTPATPADAKGLLKTAIRGNNPTFFMEAIGRGGEQGEVPDGDYTIPMGKASVIREGKDVTLIAIGSMVKPTLEAATKLAAAGIEAEVIDPRTLVPLDEAALIAGAKKTGRVVVVDEARDRCSVASHIAAVLVDKAFGALKAPIKRVTVPNVALPYAPNAELRMIPNAERIAAVATEVARA